jgi:rhodanese-related sulfurtransferase
VGKNDPVILICRTGNRTDTLSRALIEQLGYTKVYNVKEGIVRWISDGLPVVRN